MQLYLLALNPTDSVLDGFLPAAGRLGLSVTLLTDRPGPWGETGPLGDHVRVEGCDVRDHRAVISRIAGGRRADGVFTNSDHLQMQGALAAAYFGLPAKDWRAALRTKDKAEMRRRLDAAGVEPVRSAEVLPGQDPAARAEAAAVPYPCVLKPREGVASEDVVLAGDAAELRRLCDRIRVRRPADALLVEEYLPGGLHTLETLGDGRLLHLLGGFRTRLSPPPHFIEERMTYVPHHPAPVREQVLARLAALGVGFGACHTEFVLHEERVRLVEVNYRAAGDQCDLLLADLLGIPLFDRILSVHLGRALPAAPELPADRAARIDYPCADRSGTLVAAPEPMDRRENGLHQTYRPLRRPGEHHPLHRTNRDYLGVLRTIGPGAAEVDRAADAFLAGARWEIAP
ncbi:ATP-grasp domain-containing protein [Streptomyces sp. C10-9-1]|uniref:ATP-grasp domain-containing protein n=1 Tax=Streptomyces sp. C10-9-1 TaxID=1859285 RepID=UPI0021116291|nr:ATP-grasp domain-containing protein [Streptomyces sp. C10-9-1]MCQ6556218.1 ATP-grasp domain-containing protein [Streptomyces sp. C10-9-1]